jgi:hypothetical protein
MSMATINVKCDWQQCPTHDKHDPSSAITLVWPSAIQRVRYFHSTDCLAFFAAGFPSGYIIETSSSEGIL